MKKVAKITEPPKQYFDDEKKFLVYEVLTKDNKTLYYFRSGQAKFIDKLTLDGFVGLPSGLYLNRNGYGFGKKGIFLLQRIKECISHNKKLELTISKNKKKSITENTLIVKIVLPYDDAKQLLARFGKLNEENNDELREAADSFLSTKFPKKVNVSSKDFDEYKAGEVFSILSKKKVADKLSEDDLVALGNIYPKIFQSSVKKKKILSQRSLLIQKSKKITDKIYLDEVIKEFKQNLEKKTLKEEVWQKFLKEKVLKYLVNYVTAIDKENISVNTSYPDFVVVDVYGFVDIFEIKTHNTPLLSYDDSHENYYWRSEVAQAISQIENYIDEIIYNSDKYIKKIKNKKDLDIRVVRPKGLIIAGNSKQFKKRKEFEDFRKLSCSLKNIDFILYDQLLENLVNLRSKL